MCLFVLLKDRSHPPLNPPSHHRASSGTCWCSDEAWCAAGLQSGDDIERLGVVGQPLGSFQLKGVPEMELIQCRLVWRQGIVPVKGRRNVEHIERILGSM